MDNNELGRPGGLPMNGALEVSAVPVGIPDAVESAILSAAPWASQESPTNLSHWFHRVEAAGLPVPRTRIVPMPSPALDDAWRVFDGAEPGEALKHFATRLRGAASDLGAPFFLRTDLTSGKHEWSKACFVSDPNELVGHILTIACYSEMGWLPWDGNWVVREMLPTMPVGVCPRFDDMPVCKEFRFFVNGPEVECFHPYWPRHALEQGGCNLSDQAYADLCGSDELGWLHDLASRAGEAVGGRWSVDLLATERGWFLTDMAEAHKSYHWPECAAQGTEARQGGDACGSIHDGPVLKEDAPKSSHLSPKGIQ